jgi:hypothetical protein
MAFCSSCGGPLASNERFCAKCGADQTAQAAGAPAVPAAAPPAPVPLQAPVPQAAIPPPPGQPYMGVPPQVPPPPAQPFAGMPPQFPPPPPAQPYSGMPPQFPPPVIMGAPPGAQPASKNPLMWLVAAGVIFGLWYIGTHDKDNNQNPGGTPTGQTQPGPGGGGGGGGGGGNQDQAVVAAQKFTAGDYNAVNGQIQVVQGQWINGSNIPLAAAQLGCEQEDANGQNLAQSPPVTLTGPAPPGGTVTLPTFSIGAEAQGAAKVNCKITAVQTEN